MTRDGLARALREIVGPEAVIDDAEGLRPYECDGLSAFRRLPWLVVLPADAAEVAAVVGFCHAHRVCVIPRGAGTGLSGGALPVDGAVVLGLSRMNRILELDPAARLARVQPGVRNLAISEAAAPHGLFYAPDPSSQIACSIGGNVAENAGGVHCLKYGLTVHNVLALEVVLADGRQVSIGSDAPDTPGYDLLALLTGSEGMLGLVVEVTVRLIPVPANVQVMLAAFATAAEAGQAVADIIGSGLLPAGLEMMDRLAIRAAEAYAHAGYPVDAGAILLCELDGAPAADVAAQMDRAARIVRAAGASEVRIAVDAAERARFWAGRKAAFPAVGRLAPDYYCMDGTIPRRELPRVLQEIERLSSVHGLQVANVFHAGDGNLHPLILYDANTPGELERTERFGAEILELCVQVGGTITGEHGVGVEKIDQMCVQFGRAELARFHAVKSAFDPDGLLNPGKAVPTLHRCAELGAMHVHGGKLPHPELERF